VNFGISTTMWDRLFGTFQPTNEPVELTAAIATITHHLRDSEP
jgi:sterol desaturase/sphingolipid hydroxylase (fatty acid hydroxylase superfamily)